MNLLQDYIDVGLAPDIPGFESKLVAIANHFDFGIVSAAIAVDRPGNAPLYMMAGNTPQAFIEASGNMDDGRRDPVLKRLKELWVPFAYDQAMYVEEGAGDLWEEQARHGYRTGISMALHLRGGRHFMLGVDREQPLPMDDAKLMRLMADLQLLAVHAQDAAFRLLLPEAERRQPLVALTSREREVLQWTLQGKSAWTVGQLLTMSEHTVNFHLRNAMRKLEVSSKHQAAIRALEMGLL